MRCVTEMLEGTRSRVNSGMVGSGVCVESERKVMM